MASFQFVTQMQGPQIDENLLVNAAKAGTEIGKATPSGFTAAVEGVTKGISQGLDWVNQYESIEVKKQQQRLLELQTKAQQVRTNEAIANSEYSTAADRAMLEQKRVESENAVRESKVYNKFIDAYQKAPDANSKFDLILGTPTLFSSEKGRVFGDSLLKAVTAMPELSVDRQNYLAKKTQLATQQRLAETQAAKISEARAAFNGHNTTNTLIASTKLSPEALATQTELVRSDTFEIGPDGNLITLKGTRKPLVKTPTGEATDYIMFSKRPDGTRGDILATGVPADYYKVWQLGGQAYRQITPQADVVRSGQIAPRIPNASPAIQRQQQIEKTVSSAQRRSSILAQGVAADSAPLVDPRPSAVEKRAILTNRSTNYNKIADKSSVMPISPATVNLIDSAVITDKAGKFNLTETSEAATVLYRALGMPMGYNIGRGSEYVADQEIKALTSTLLNNIQTVAATPNSGTYEFLTTNAKINEMALESSMWPLALAAAKLEAKRDSRLSSLAYAKGTEDYEVLSARAKTIQETILAPYVDKLRARANATVRESLNAQTASSNLIALKQQK